MANDHFRLDLSPFKSGLNALDDKFGAAVYMYAQTGAQKLRNHAQGNAPWTDRTGDARRRLNTSVRAADTGKGYMIILQHGVDYGIWLELAHEKRFAIIDPTIKEVGPEVLRGFQGMLNRLGR